MNGTCSPLELNSGRPIVVLNSESNLSLKPLKSSPHYLDTYSFI